MTARFQLILFPVAALLATFALGVWVGHSWLSSAVTKEVENVGVSASSKTTLPPTIFSPTSVHEASPRTVAVSALDSIPATTGPTSRLASLIASASQMTNAQALAALRKLERDANPAESAAARQVLVARLAELDPEAALSYSDTLAGDEHSRQRLNVMGTWAGKDPAAASAYLKSQANGGIANDSDREAAAAIAREWATRDPRAALAWAQSLNEDVRDQAIARVMGQLATIQPQAAIQAAQNLPAGYERADAMQPIAAQWAETAPVAAASWVQSLRNAEEQARAANGLVTTWASNDPMTASQWVAKLAPGTTRDAAVSALISASTLRNDPEAATLWAATVQDPALRAQLISAHSARWLLQDAAAANAWLAAQKRP